MKTLKAIQYTERCIAVIGDTKPLKDQLKQAGGKFNPYLKVNGSTVAGWVFSVNRKDQIAGIIEGVTIEAQPIDVKPEQKPIETIKPIKEQKIKVFLKGEESELKNGEIFRPTEEINIEDFNPRLHYPVNGYGEIKLKISPDADLSYKKPERLKEKPFKAIFEGLYNGEMTFKTAKELEKFVFELRNIPVGKDEKGRTLYKYAEGNLKVQLVQL